MIAPFQIADFNPAMSRFEICNLKSAILEITSFSSSPDTLRRSSPGSR
jgi:hypothetical protein